MILKIFEINNKHRIKTKVKMKYNVNSDKL